MKWNILYIVVVVIVMVGVIVLLGRPSDPFGAEPLPAEFNCGPEDRYDFGVDIGSKEEFVDFVKNHEINQWVMLDDFKEDDVVDWDKVLAAVKEEKVGFRTIYILDYNPAGCSGFTLKMTDDGLVSVYGCCGK
jgi:hypothetical protein